jgi:CTP synthase (UTP-ammonia lyase)
VNARRINVGLVGEYNAGVLAHRAIPLALRSGGEHLGVQVALEWLRTDRMAEAPLDSLDGIWCVPASPYRSMEGALLAIHHARTVGVPFLGTCGGFQHAVIEYARNALGWLDADHGETSPEGSRLVIAELACALVETTLTMRLDPGTRIAAAYGANEVTETYRCRYGLNPEFQEALVAGRLRANAWDETGEVRGIELDGHPFFVATLFQPERAVLQGRPAPLVQSFVAACCAR